MKITVKEIFNNLIFVDILCFIVTVKEFQFFIISDPRLAVGQKLINFDHIHHVEIWTLKNDMFVHLSNNLMSSER